MDEVWKDIKGYEGKYQVSSKGRVRSLNFHREKRIEILKQQIRNGYNFVPLIKNKIRYQPKVHRLVAEHFIPNSKNKSQVNHKNAIKTDNRVDNLEWVTAKENREHAKKFNLYTNGEDLHLSKLKEKDIIAIRKSTLGCHKLGIKYNVSRSTIARIKNRTTWKHVLP